MSFPEDFFKKKENAKSVILIDIAGESVAGAYARYEEGQLPTILYFRHVPIETQERESHQRAMIRALGILGKNLIREGAPLLVRATGSGTADPILVSVDAPWQDTRVRIEQFEQREPFVFTQELVAERLKETSITPSEKTLVNESVIGTILNGYETHNPYGKEVHRAEVVVLTSFVEREVAHDIIATLGRLYHTKNILPISGNSLRYQTMRTVFPHEDDAVILDATGGLLTSIVLVRKGIFVTLIQVAGAPGDAAWISNVTSELSELSKRYPLPRTIFLLSRESEMPSLRDKLGTARFSALWLSDNPPKIVPVTRSTVTSLIRQVAIEPADIVTLLMAVYYQANRSRKET